MSVKQEKNSHGLHDDYQLRLKWPYAGPKRGGGGRNDTKMRSKIELNQMFCLGFQKWSRSKTLALVETTVARLLQIWFTAITGGPVPSVQALSMSGQVHLVLN